MQLPQLARTGWSLRRRHAAVRVALVTALLAVSSAPSNAQGIAGRWLATFDAGVTRNGGTTQVDSRRQAVLQLTQRGDSVHGTWKAGDSPLRDVAGTFDGKTLAFKTDVTEEDIRVNGKSVKMKSVTEWSATFTGDTLAGTMLVRLGERAPPLRKWEARR